MQLSNSGRIVLIDDNYKEAMPLIRTFGKLGVPYLYYDGMMENMPETPPGGIRLIILDIELQGMQGQDIKTKASGITARIKKLISTSNGPYIIIFWTKHTEVITQITENCRKANIPPIISLDLEKVECIKDDDSCDIELLIFRLKEKLATIGAFRLYVKWENILHSASNQFISRFSSLIPHGKDWSKGTSTLFYKLYKGYVEKNEISGPEEQFKCACLLMNLSFIDTLQRYVESDLKLPDGFKLTSGTIDEPIIAKLNSSLFLSYNLLERPATGYVYLDENDSLKDILIADYFKNAQAPLGTELCKIVITPECDLAQNKTLKVRTKSGTEQKMHRIIYGLFFCGENPIKKRNDAQFYIGPIWYNEIPQHITLYLATVSFLHEGSLTTKPLFSLRRDLVFDLQSKAANHVNRLGNFQLG